MAVSYVPAGPHRSAVVGHALTFVLLLVCVSAQIAWPGWLKLHGQAPDLTLAAVISLGLTAGAPAGALAGFLGAFLWASVAALPMGNLFIAHMGLGFLAGAMRGRMFSDRLSLAMILIGAGVIVAAIVNLLLAPPPTPQSWISVVLARAFYGAVAAMAIYPLVRLLSRYYPVPEEL
jgi:cell shape-determining protein MreD